MNIEEQFNLIAKAYDKDRSKLIPCFDAYYEGATDFLAHVVSKPNKVLDLGAGTGLLTSYWFRHFSEAKYLLVDVADEMLNIARKRFEGLSNISYATLDYTKTLPSEDFDLIISALSIHHLTDDQKIELFRNVYEKLPQDGVFINYDQFCSDEEAIDHAYETYWLKQIKESGISEMAFNMWQERKKLDKECSVATEIKMLRKSGFHAVECVFSQQKFSVIIAHK